ncbi:hypothetical protein ES703_90489 [subsurface metagenome]
MLGVGEWDDYFWFTDNTGDEHEPQHFGGYPEFTYYKMNDEQNLYFAIIVNDPTPLEKNDDMWLAFRDAEDNYKEFRKGFTLVPAEYGKYSEQPWASSFLPLPAGVEFGWSNDADHIYYEWKIPLAVLGVNPGDTIKYLTHVRDNSVDDGLNYHPEITGIDDTGEYQLAYAMFTYAYIHQFGDLLID